MKVLTEIVKDVTPPVVRGIRKAIPYLAFAPTKIVLDLIKESENSDSIGSELLGPFSFIVPIIPTGLFLGFTGGIYDILIEEFTTTPLYENLGRKAFYSLLATNTLSAWANVAGVVAFGVAGVSCCIYKDCKDKFKEKYKQTERNLMEENNTNRIPRQKTRD